MKLFKQLTLTYLFCLTVLTTNVFAHNAEDNFDLNALPLLGNSDQQYLSKQQAIQIGDGFYNEAMVSNILIDDIEINLYLRSLITNLFNSSQFNGKAIRILIINNSDINAFALPGNIIVIHSGLFLAVQKESELVGVLAHELSHLKQQHLVRLFANQQRNQPKLLLSVIAAILLSKDAQTSNAILTAGIASSTQGTLDYTRRQEYEADRVAINVLVKAGYDPKGISDFFEILASKSGLSNNLASGSEFLRTHPLSQNRIAEAKNRIQNIDSKNLIKNSVRFERLKIKLASITNLPIKSNQFTCYTELLNAQKIIKIANVSTPLKQCTNKKINAHNYLKHESLNLLSVQNNPQTEKLFKQLIKNNPERIEYPYSLLKHYYFYNQHQKYINLAENFLRQFTPLFPDFYQTLSRVYFQNNQPHLAKYFLATYYHKLQKNSLAKRILKKLLAENMPDRILYQKTQNLLDSIIIKPKQPH